MDKELVIIDHLRLQQIFKWVLGHSTLLYFANFDTLNFRGMTMSDTRHISEAFIKSFKSILLFFKI